MHELWRKFSQWDEDKATPMKSRMRQRQKLCVADLISVKEKIQVNCARRHRYFALSSEGVVDLRQTRHYFVRRRQRITAQLRNHVEKGGLRNSFCRLSLVDSGEARNL